MKKVAVVVLIVLGSMTVNILALLIGGWWWITSVTGLLMGLFLCSARVSFLLALCVGGLSWGLPLALLAMNAPMERVANAVESVVDLSATGGIALIVLTIVLGCVLSVAGAWVGFTGKRFM